MGAETRGSSGELCENQRSWPSPGGGAEPGQVDRVHVQKTQHGAPGDSERSTLPSLESWACTEEKREPGKGKCGMRQEGLTSQAGALVI